MRCGWRALVPAPWAREQVGQGLGEYALIILFVALMVIVMLALLGTQLSNTFSAVISSFDAITP